MNILTVLMVLLYIWVSVAALAIIFKSNDLTKEWVNSFTSPFKWIYKLIKSTVKETKEEIEKEKKDENTK